MSLFRQIINILLFLMLYVCWNGHQLGNGQNLCAVCSWLNFFTCTGEELCRLQKQLNDFTFEITQLQAQLDSVHREKSVLQSKQIEMERMHIQMKEAMSADISYLRKLNFQMVEQRMRSKWTCLLTGNGGSACNLQWVYIYCKYWRIATPGFKPLSLGVSEHVYLLGMGRACNLQQAKY